MVFAAGEKDLRRLRLSDGELLGRVPNLKQVAADPSGNGFAAEYGGAGRPVRCYGSDAEVAWSRTAWRWLSSVWAPAGLLVGFPRFYPPVPVPGDSVGQVWCLEPGTGAKLWEWKAPPSAHVVACGYREHGTQFIGLLYYYDIPRPLEQELLLWSAGGDLLERHAMPVASPGSWTIDVAFFNRGDWLVGAGYVLDVSTGEVLWRFNSADAGQGGEGGQGVIQRRGAVQLQMAVGHRLGQFRMASTREEHQLLLGGRCDTGHFCSVSSCSALVAAMSELDPARLRRTQPSKLVCLARPTASAPGGTSTVMTLPAAV